MFTPLDEKHLDYVVPLMLQRQQHLTIGFEQRSFVSTSGIEAHHDPALFPDPLCRIVVGHV
jgi:hypothetical protein